MILIAIMLGALRLDGVKDIAFQTMAHVYIGAILGAWLVSRKPFYLWIEASLVILEILCFLFHR